MLRVSRDMFECRCGSFPRLYPGLPKKAVQTMVTSLDEHPLMCSPWLCDTMRCKSTALEAGGEEELRDGEPKSVGYCKPAPNQTKKKSYFSRVQRRLDCQDLGFRFHACFKGVWVHHKKLQLASALLQGHTRQLVANIKCSKFQIARVGVLRLRDMTSRPTHPICAL